MFFKVVILKNFTAFTGKHQRWSLFSVKLQTWRPAGRLQHRCFPMNIAKFLRTPFLQSTSGGCFCKMMKFYKDICWLSFSQIDIIWVVKTQQKYLRSIEMYFYGVRRVFGLSGSQPPALISGPRPAKDFQLVQPPLNQSPVTMIMCTVLI